MCGFIYFRHILDNDKCLYSGGKRNAKLRACEYDEKSNPKPLIPEKTSQDTFKRNNIQDSLFLSLSEGNGVESYVKLFGKPDSTIIDNDEGCPIGQIALLE